jgi:hypothetical protein
MRGLRARPDVPRSVHERRRQRGTPPDAVGVGPLISSPGLRLGAVVIVRDEAPNLEEWLAYHHALGVGHFFIYDNGSTDDLPGVIEPWVNHGLATLLHWPLPGGQIDAYSHALRFFGPSADWLGFFDVDEFVVPLIDADIPALLGRWPDAADVRMPRVDFGYSGHRTRPGGLTIEAFTEVADVFGRDPAKPPRVKTILRPRSVSAVGIHTATVADMPVTKDGRAVPTTTVGPACHPYVQLNHYYTRSFEEFEAKRFKGSGTGRIARPAIPFDLPTLRIDTSAHRFIEPTLATLELMRSLEPSPYHYGSQLALGQFPHFNDLGLFAEFAMVNALLDEPQPRREPRARLENRFPGMGFVAEVSSLPRPPRRGELSLSVHLAPLLERSRGRLESSWAVAPAEVASRLRSGTAEETEEGWRLTAGAEGVSVDVPIDDGGRRRCYAAGFVLRSGAPIRIVLDLAPPDGNEVWGARQREVTLEGAGTYAGVVEISGSPERVGLARLHLETAGEEALMHDLFVVSYG